MGNKDGQTWLAAQSILGTVEACGSCHLYAQCLEDNWLLLGSFAQGVRIVTEGNKDRIPLSCHFRGDAKSDCVLKNFYRP